MRKRWAALLAVLALAGLASGVVFAALAGARRAGTAVDRYRAHTGDPDLIVFTGGPVPPDVEAGLKGDPRVSAVLATELGILFPEGSEPGRDIGVLAVPGEAAADSPWRPWVLRGRLPAPGAADEVAVSEMTARQRGLVVGDEVRLVGVPWRRFGACFSGDPGDCETVPAGSAEITGIFRYTVDLGGEPDDERMLLADRALLEARPDVARANLVFAWADSPANVDQVVSEYAVRVPQGDVTAGDDTLPGVRRATVVQREALVVAALVIGIATLAIVAPAYGRHLAQRRAEVEVLGALGMCRRHRAWAGAFPGLVGAPVATAVALGTGVLLSPLLPIGVARRADPDVGLNADWAVAVPGAVAVAAGMAGVAGFVAWRWSRRADPSSAARGAGAGARLAALGRLSPSATTGASFALDTGRGARRLPVVPTLAAVVTGLAFVVAALVVAASLGGLLGRSDRFGAPWDLVGAPDDPRALDDLAAGLLEEPQVEGLATAAYGELEARTFEGRSTEAGTVGFATLRGDVAPTVLEGTPMLADDEVLAGFEVLDRLRLRLGDRLALHGPGGSEVVRVVGTTILPDIGAATVDDGFLVPMELFDRLGASSLVDPLDAQVVALVDVVPGRDDAVAERIRAAGAAPSPPLPPPQAWSLRDVRPVARLLALVTALLAALAAFHALATGVRRRGHELGVLRALGLAPRQAAGAVRWQAVTLALIALAVGVPLGIVAGRTAWRSVASAVRVVPVVDLPGPWLLLLAVLVTAGSFVLAVVPAWRAARLRPGEVLRSE